MGIVFRQSVKSSVVILAGAMLGAAIIYLSQKYLPEQQFGFSRLFTTIAATSGQLLMFGMNATLGVYVHKYEPGNPKRHLLITASLLIPLLLTCICTVLFFLLHDQFIHLYKPQDIPFFRQFYMWLPLYSALFLYQVILEQYLSSQMKVALSIFFREIALRLLNIVLIALFALGYMDFHLFIVGSVLVYAGAVAPLLFLSFRTEGFGLSLNYKIFSRAEVKELTHFTWYHILLSLSLILMGTIDVIMLGALSPKGVSSVAGYAIAVFVISILQVPYKAMTNATFPVMTQAYKAGDMEKVHDVFNRSGINIFIASLAMALVIGCNLHNLVALLEKGYESVAPLVLIMMAGRLADMATGLNNELLSISNYYKISFYLSLLLLCLMIVFNYLLIPVYGIYGAAWATSIAYLIFNLGKLYFVWKRLDMLPFTATTWRVAAAAVVTLIPGYFMPHLRWPLADAAVRSALVCAVFAVLLIWWKASPDLNTYLASIRKNKRLF